MEASSEKTPPATPRQEAGKSTIDVSKTGTDSTEVSTTTTSAATKTVSSLSDRLQHMSVSPPRERSLEESSPLQRATTPPPVAVPPPRGSKPATPINSDSSSGTGLVRNRSSPSLLDASPKSATAAPPRSSSSSSRRSPTVAFYARGAAELTPVTRNTQSGFVDGGAVVSPEEKLHGELLALPSGDDYGQQQHGGLQQPPLQQRRFSSDDPPYLPVAARTMDVATAQKQNLVESCYKGGDDDSSEGDRVGEAVQFPSRKIYSFTSGQQYKAAVEEERGALAAAEPPLPERGGLKPYQPSRNDMAGVGLPREETSRIFISRHGHKSINGSSSEEGSRSSGLNAIPLEERQWSIPSIRMANHVQGSTTDYTDEEDDLFRGYDDDASLSSRGSSLYLPEEGTSAEAPRGVVSNTPLFHSTPPPVVIEDGMDRVFHMDNVPDASAAAVAPSTGAVKQEQETPRRRKKRTKNHDDKEHQAYEWLRTVELGPENNVFCEAASSKFLTGGAFLSNPPLNRTESSPATMSKDDEAQDAL